MQHFNLDNYVVDVLMPDLVGHDRRPAAFLVYLYFLRHAARGKRDTLSVSLQTIAAKTGDPAFTPAQAARPHGIGDCDRPGSPGIAAVEPLSRQARAGGIY